MCRRDKLALYRKKRDFTVTPEPSGEGKAPASGSRYVIQMHAARRLHYDLRLEIDGVYKSWAVTRGPSLDPKDRRLAVEVEDHPIEYGTFEGTIPQGEYGGGAVMLWDRGTWIPEGDPRKAHKRGHITFEFKGERLKGGFSLIRMADRDQGKGRKVRHNWLLIKKNDRWAKPGHGDAALENATSIKTGRAMRQIAEGPGPTWDSTRTKRALKKNVAAIKAEDNGKRGRLPAVIEPELTTLVDAPPSGGNWVHEVKFDGYRMGGRIEDGKARLITRSGLDWTRRFPLVAKALKKTGIKSGWVDGEIVVPDENGLSSFSGLQRALSDGDDRRMVFYVFDLPHLNGRDLRNLPLVQRKQLLRKTLFAKKASSVLAYSEHHEAEGHAFYKAACSMALEGVVSKRKDSPYRSGRGRDWVKSKCIDRDEFVVGGYTPSRTGRGIGSLLVGHYEGSRLVYDGRTGTGFSAKESLVLEKALRSRQIEQPPFDTMERAYKARAHWVKPELVAEVGYRGRSSDGLLRQSSYQGLRDDKPAKQIAHDDRAAAPSKSMASDIVAGVKITHPSRVIDPTTGKTKLDVARYYERVAKTLLLDMSDRPVAVVRNPGGITGESFFQRHPQQTLKGRISAVTDPEDKEQLLAVRTVKDLVTLVQFGVLEIHPWQTRIDALDKADRFILDLDPAPDVPFAAVTLAARLVRKRLDELGLRSIVKTTGGKGLHVIVPLRPAATWAVAKGFARAIADGLARDEPRIFLAKASKAARKGRIYLDYLRNDRGSTAIGAYCVRARQGLPVAMPLDWSQVRETLQPADYTIETVGKVALPRDWKAARGWRQGLDAKRRKAVGME